VSDKSKPMTCERHGKSYATFVCSHLVGGEGLGLVVAYDPDDLRPEAWCAQCDAVLMEDGEWNDRSEAFANFKAICANCYDEVRRRNVVHEETRQNKSWFLENALTTHLHHPDTFQLPDRDVRERLQLDDYVKITFLLPAKDEEGEYFQGERMWVWITEIDELGYVGVLDSDPMTKGSIQPGDEVLFGPEHVISVGPSRRTDDEPH